MKNPTTPTTLALALCSALLGSCGSNGGGGSPATPDEPDSYNGDAFGYTDPNPDAFHPLGKSAFAATRLDEGMVFFNRIDGNGDVRPGDIRMREDVQQGSAQVGIGSTQFAANNFVPQDGCSGDVDGDGVVESIFVGVTSSGGQHRTAVRVSQPNNPDANGDYAYVESEQFSLIGEWTDVVSVSCATGDMDGDGKQELVITESRSNQMNVRVLELVYDGGIPVYATRYLGSYTGDMGSVALGQFDDDPGLELVVAHGWTGSDEGDITIEVRDDLTAGVGHLGNVASHKNSRVVDLMVGEFDGDRYDEIGLGEQYYLKTDFISGVGGFRRLRTWVTAYNWVPGSGATSINASSFDSDWEWDRRGLRSHQRFVAADLNEDGLDEMTWISPAENGFFIDIFASDSAPHWLIWLYSWSPVSNVKTETYLYNAEVTPPGSFADAAPAFRGGDLAVVDDDGSGDDNILITLGVLGNIGPNQNAYQILNFKDDDSFNVGYLSINDPTVVPVMTGGDFDGEGLRVKYTGTKYQHLPNPIPMVMLAAPPTKQGIEQNYDDSESSYSVSEGTTEAYEVSTSTSMSVSVGYEAEDIFGSYGASASATISNEVEKNTGKSSTLTTSKTFAGSYAADAIVFEGTLHTCYEYLVVGAQDESVIGTIISVNVPVATEIFKWTTDFYNDNVDESQHVPDDVFTHSIGDPASYPSQAALIGLLDSNGGDYEGWEGTSVTTGQGSATNGIGISLENELSEGQTHTYGVEASAEVKIGGATFGTSVGLSESYMYEVTVSRGTEYEGTIGDIAAEDWPTWFYKTGMVVYTHAAVGKKPFQVMQYWTDTLGSGYSGSDTD